MKKALAKIAFWLLRPYLGHNGRYLPNGMAFANSLGKFMAESAEADGPRTTSITCKMGDSDVTVLRIWATTDGNTPVNRVHELCEERDELRAMLETIIDHADEPAMDDALFRKFAKSNAQETLNEIGK